MEIERKILQEILNNLRGNCGFWACPGPYEKIQDMKTCGICRSIITLRELLKERKHG